MKTETTSYAADVEGMCRLCLCECNDENSVEIFFSNDLSLTVRIMACAGLEVTQQDILPKRICIECRLTLEKSFLFRNKCKNSDSKLRRHIRLVNAGKVSNVFNDSEDEYEEDYTESLNLIRELENRLNQNQKSYEEIEDGRQATHQQRNTNDMKTTFDNQLPNTYKSKIRDTIEVPISNAFARTRSSNRLKNVGRNGSGGPKIAETSIIYDSNGQTIEVLMDDIGDDPETEFIIADPIDNAFEEQFHSADSNDELDTLLVDENQFETESFTLQDITKTDEMYMSEESTDEKVTDEYEGDENYDASILESILPTIKESIAAKSGTVLDDKTQYKIIGSNGNEIKVQCFTSDGKEFEIEMQQTNADYERDESGDLKIFACSKCPKTFSRRGKLINHERDHNAKSNGQECPYCSKWFPSNSTLTRHIRVHTGEKPFKCNVCNRSFIQKEILKRHQMTHSGERPFKCAHCPKSFILKEALRQHINRNHIENPTPEMHNCPFCPKSFCHSSGLSRHLLVHAGRTFACEYCHKKFNDKSALKRHTVSIHNVTPASKK